MLTETEMKNRESLAMAIECIIRHHRFTTEQAIMDDPKFDPLKRSMPRELATAADLINVVLTNLEGGSNVKSVPKSLLGHQD